MNHTPECLSAERDRVGLAARYAVMWPNYCRTCQGAGEQTWEERHPYGSTVACETLSEPCDTCYGKCPRCAHEIGEEAWEQWYDSGDPCTNCGWHWGRNFGDLPPEEWDGVCGCWGESL